MIVAEPPSLRPHSGVPLISCHFDVPFVGVNAPRTDPPAKVDRVPLVLPSALKYRTRLTDRRYMPGASGNIQIVRPPRLFLDTNHLINIAGLRKGKSLPPGQSPEAYSFIDQCITQHFGMVFLQSAVLDWVDGDATEDSAREIAQVLDSAKLRYLFESDTSVYLREVLDECHRLHPELNVPQFDVLHLVSDGEDYEPSELKIAARVPEYLSEGAQQVFAKLIKAGITHVPNSSVQTHVKETIRWKHKHLETYKKRVKGFNEMLSEDIAGTKEYFANPQPFHIGWIRGFLKADKVLVAWNGGLDVDSAVNILRELDLRQCPSVWLYIKAHEHRMRAGHAPADNEVDDWFILPVVSYTDVVLVDRGFRDFILRADSRLKSKVFANAADATRVLAAMAAPFDEK